METIRSRSQDDDGDREERKITLERKISIDRDENVELLLRAPEQLPVL
jgi:hypothetical protein